MELKERDYWLGFNLFPGIGTKRFFYLLKVFGSAKRAWQASTSAWNKLQLPKNIIKSFLIYREKEEIALALFRLDKQLISFLIIEDKDYPFNLKKIDNKPPLIYIKGQLKPEDCRSIAVVGTRKITPYGYEVTEKLVKELTAYGLTIVSGLARGVDSVVHRVTLGNGGRTLAVLGSGLDRIYPPEHKALADKIVYENRGALISLLPLGTAPLKGHFPHRNRIISGLSLGVLVTEGLSLSGTKITAGYCIEQNRKLFAVPGPISSPYSTGPAELINLGAKLVTKAKDVIDSLAIKAKPKDRFSKPPADEVDLQDPQAKIVYQLLLQGTKHVDELVRNAHLPSPKVLALLTTLELKGMVKNIGEGNYIIN